MIKNKHFWLRCIFLLISSQIYSQITIQNGAALTVLAGEEITIEGEVVNAGTISGKGLFTIGDDFINQGTVAIEIDAVGHTTFNVANEFMLNGTFTITDNSTPSSGDQITIATAGSPITSSFSNLESNNWFANYNLPNAGEFTISYLSMLPVELINFRGQSVEEGIQIDWQTASEQNNKGYILQRRSSNAIDWLDLSFVEGIGTTSELQHYAYIDHDPFVGINYYRLKQIDFDEHYEFSEIINVNNASLSNEVIIFPNPTSDVLHVDLSTLLEQTTTVQLINKFGQVIFETKKEKEERNFSLDLSSYPGGPYYLQFTQNHKPMVSKKIIIQKF